MDMNKENDKLQIRNSTAEFLIFTAQSGENSIDVMVVDENVWLTQDMISTLYEKGRSTITEHLKNIFSDSELDENSVCRKFRRTGADVKEDNTKFYKLEAVQNKLHFAIHGKTAAELIIDRANAEKENMGLTSWRNAPKGKILKSDVSVAKNYLSLDEIDSLNRIVTMYLDYAENQAKRKIPITMEDWANKLNAFLQFNEYEILNNSGKVTAEIAKAFAESEYEKYRIVQDRLFENDFDRLLKESGKNN